jgi:hypothetical protein
MAGMTPLVSTAAGTLPQHLRAAASFNAAAATAAGLPSAGLQAAGLPAGLTLGPAQAAYANAAAAAALDPYLGQSIGPIAGYQNALYRRFAPY